MTDDRTTRPQVHPLPLSCGDSYDASNNDQESGTGQSKEFRRKKRMKCCAYILAFTVFQTGIIVLFALTVMKIRTPKYRVQHASFDEFEVGTAADPAFRLRMNAQIGIKNSNFGVFKFKSSPIVLYYDGSPVGQAIVPGTQAGWRTTKKLNVTADIYSEILTNKTQLGKDLGSGILKLNALSTLRGKVRVAFTFKKKKTTNMNCTIVVGLADKAVREINCQ